VWWWFFGLFVEVENLKVVKNLLIFSLFFLKKDNLVLWCGGNQVKEKF
jgi:hypothetical protein